MSIVLRLLTHDGGMHDEIIRDLDGSPAILGSDAGALAGTKPANLTLLFLRLDHPHSLSFIFSFKTEYSILLIYILSFIFYSSAPIIL
jgi:hypothetical protein